GAPSSRTLSRPRGYSRLGKDVADPYKNRLTTILYGHTPVLGFGWHPAVAGTPPPECSCVIPTAHPVAAAPIPMIRLRTRCGCAAGGGPSGRFVSIMLACSSSGGVGLDWNPAGGISVPMMTIWPADTAILPPDPDWPEFRTILALPRGVTVTCPE